LGALRWLITFRTPGWARAARASMPVIRPRATLLSTMTACTTPSGLLSPAYFDLPVTLSRASTRGTDAPTAACG
jgi:hypothetical protein